MIHIHNRDVRDSILTDACHRDSGNAKTYFLQHGSRKILVVVVAEHLGQATWHTIESHLATIEHAIAPRKDQRHRDQPTLWVTDSKMAGSGDGPVE